MDASKLNLSPEIIIDMIIRRRWILLLSLSVTLTIGIILSVILPKSYQTKTLILIEPQRVPQNYVQSIVTEDPGDRVNTISQLISSRTNLEQLIKDFDLFSGKENENMFMEDKIANLRRRIGVKVTRARRGPTFSISFQGKDPELIQKVANRLATYFIDENLKVRETRALGTSEFLQSELVTMRNRLEYVEENIKNYRKINMGELPEQLDANLRVLDRLQANMSARRNNIRQLKMRLMEFNNQFVANTQSAASSDQPIVGADVGSNLMRLNNELESLLSKYTEKHPDVVRLKNTISELEKKRMLQNQELQGRDGADTAIINHSDIEVRRQVYDIKREIKIAEEDIDNLKNQIDEYDQRVENTPRREQELISLRRDYENIQESYNSLLNRKLEADIAVNMERKQKGEQFRIIDTAKVPEKPISPKVSKLFAVSLLLGVGAGGGIIVLLEFINPSFRKANDLEAAFEIPVMATIPRLLNKRQILFNRLNVISSIAYCCFVGGLLLIFGLIVKNGSDQIVTLVKRFVVS